MDAKNNNASVLRKEEETPTGLQVKQILPAVHVLFSPLFQQVSIVANAEKRPSAAYHLTADGDLVWSDPKAVVYGPYRGKSQWAATSVGRCTVKESIKFLPAKSKLRALATRRAPTPGWSQI